MAVHLKIVSAKAFELMKTFRRWFLIFIILCFLYLFLIFCFDWNTKFDVLCFNTHKWYSMTMYIISYYYLFLYFFFCISFLYIFLLCSISVFAPVHSRRTEICLLYFLMIYFFFFCVVFKKYSLLLEEKKI